MFIMSVQFGLSQTETGAYWLNWFGSGLGIPKWFGLAWGFKGLIWFDLHIYQFNGLMVNGLGGYF